MDIPLCPQCGKAKEPHVRFGECKCGKPVKKHDGELSKSGAHVEYAQGFSCTIVQLSEQGETWHLFPSEALSLLAWLQQEKSTLERLAKEQEA